MSSTCLSAETLIAWVQRFARFPSQQTELLEADPAVKAFITDCFAPVMDEIGLSYRMDGMGNLIAEAGPEDAAHSILFLSYAMTHPAANMADPFEASLFETDNGTAVRGRGIAEQKAALTAAIAAVADAMKSQPPLRCRLIFALSTAGETGRHDAAARIMAELDRVPTFAIVCVGTGSQVAIGNKGRIDFDLIVHGKASHSSAPWNGVNALSGSMHVLRQLEDLDLDVPDHPEFGPATLTPTAIESFPKATHTVPDKVRITFDRRLLPGEDPQYALDAIGAQISLPHPWRLTLEPGPLMYPNEISLQGRLFQTLRSAFAAAGAAPPEAIYCNFALDAGYFAQHGVEAAMLGPGAVAHFHADDEYVLVAELVKMAKIYRAIIDHIPSG